MKHYDNKYELFVGNDETIKQKRAKEVFEAMKFQVEHIDHYFAATRSTELSLDTVQKSMERSVELDGFQGREVWQVVGSSNEVDSWVLVPKNKP